VWQRKLIEDLTKLGLDNHLPIPTIAIVGSQSSGKSSVMEAISGVR